MFWKRQFSTIFTMDRFTPKQRDEIVALYSMRISEKYRVKKARSDNTIRRYMSNFFLDTEQ